jgi:hypothetical protein
MNKQNSLLFVILLLVLVAAGAGCGRQIPVNLVGTWKGTTKLDQDIIMTFGSDSSIRIETMVDSVRQVRGGTFHLVDRRVRIVLAYVETFAGNTPHRITKVDQDEAVLTMTHKDEFVLRKGDQVVIFEREGGLPRSPDSR